MKLTSEPTMHQIDDYDNNETPQKRKEVHLIIVGLIVLSAIYVIVKFSNDTVSDYIGTEQSPGIQIVHH